MTDPDDIRTLAGREWRGYVEPLLPIGERLVALVGDPEDGQLRQEVYRAVPRADRTVRSHHI
jgi:hypothetical protein